MAAQELVEQRVDRGARRRRPGDARDRPVVELAVGTGRIAIPIARAGIDVIGVDSSPGMLAVARAAADEAGVSHRLDLRLGDLREPPVTERVPLVLCPFRTLLHMETEDEKLRALRAARGLLEPNGTFVFDVFAPSARASI